MKRFQKKLIAGAVSLAMVLSAGVLPSNSASAAKKIKLSSSKVTVKVGETKKVTVKNAPKKAKVKWSSKKPKIAKVDQKGKITGVKKGDTSVTAKVTYTQNKKKKTTKLTVKVTVKEASVATTEAPTPEVPAASEQPAPEATASAEPEATTSAPEATTSAPLTVTVPEVASNLVEGEGEKKHIEGGHDETIVKKDNGSVRRALTSQEMIKNEMGLGINLGNTMEACMTVGTKDSVTDVTKFEQAWGASITTQEYIDAVHSYGFNTLRIPVAWTSMVKEGDDTYTIDPKMLGRVEEIANYALNNGMYVIINIHWDYGWWGQFGAANADGTVNQTMRDNARKRYHRYWEQISARFKDYSDHLIFESANEEWGNNMNDPTDETGYRNYQTGIEGTLTVPEQYKLANELNQEFLDIVRASGGNNPYRHLLIAGINTDIDKTINSQFAMPKDTEENGISKLSVSVHYYSPWEYCGDGKFGTVYTNGDKQNHKTQFALMRRNFVEKGYGVMIGEYGVCNPRQDQVVEYLNDVLDAMLSNSCLPVLWDTPGTYFDRKACKMKYRDVAELFNFRTGANGDTNIRETTGAPKAGGDFLEVPADTEPVWSWTGRWKKNLGDIGLDGNKVEPAPGEDVTPNFVQTTDCTNNTQISFNDWGWQTFLSKDIFAGLKKPYLLLTFANDTNVGTLQLASCATPGGDTYTPLNYTKYEDWAGLCVPLSDDLIEGIKENGWMQLTFDGDPTVSKIEIFDLGEE